MNNGQILEFQSATVISTLCTVLNYTASKGHLWRHEVKVHKLRPYKCTLCLETFVRKCELLDHCGTYHEGEKMPVGSNKLPFKCTVCAVSFLSNALLLVHKANHGDLRRDGKLKVWQYGLWSFQAGGTKLDRFLPKNQHTFYR